MPIQFVSEYNYRVVCDQCERVNEDGTLFGALQFGWQFDDSDVLLASQGKRVDGPAL